MNKTTLICPVCGFANLQFPPYDEYGNPSYEICGCCGFEYGFDDSSNGLTFVKYREEWIEKGFKFFRKNAEPVDWDFESMKAQLENTKKVNYCPRILK